MRPNDRRITVDAELYHAPGDQWKVVPPKKATVIDPGPYQIVRQWQGVFCLVSWHRTDTGNAVLVHLDGEKGPRAVPARELRGQWRETLAKTGRTAAGVKAFGALLSELATGEVTTGGLQRLAAADEGLPDDVFGMVRRASDDEPIVDGTPPA